jgi:hypothetical protein
MLISDEDREQTYAQVLSPELGPSLTDYEKQLLEILIKNHDGISPNNAMMRASGNPPTMLNQLAPDSMRQTIGSLAQKLIEYYDSHEYGALAPYRLHLLHNETTDYYLLDILFNEPSPYAVVPEPFLAVVDPISHEARQPAKVFLCHSSADKTSVRELREKLLKSGFQPWLDETDLVPGDEWEPKIKQVVRHSDIVLVCLSKSSLTKTGFVQKEIRFARRCRRKA